LVLGEVKVATVPETRYKASAMIFFSDIITACEAVKLLEKAPVAAVEVMDNASLRSMKNTSASTNQIS